MPAGPGRKEVGDRTSIPSHFSVQDDRPVDVEQPAPEGHLASLLIGHQDHLRREEPARGEAEDEKAGSPVDRVQLGVAREGLGVRAAKVPEFIPHRVPLKSE